MDVLLGYREAQGDSAIPVQGFRYDMYARIIHTYHGQTDLDQISQICGGTPIYFCFLLVSVGQLVSVGHHDAFLGYRVDID